MRGETANRDQNHAYKPTAFGTFRQSGRPNHRGRALATGLLGKAKRWLDALCLSEGRARHGGPRFLTECREDSRGGSTGEMRGGGPSESPRQLGMCQAKRL